MWDWMTQQLMAAIVVAQTPLQGISADPNAGGLGPIGKKLAGVVWALMALGAFVYFLVAAGKFGKARVDGNPAEVAIAKGGMTWSLVAIGILGGALAIALFAWDVFDSITLTL